MSYNGLGTFTINSSGQPVSSGQTISSSVFNALTSDLASGLTNVICKDGQQTTTASIPFAFGLSTDTLKAYTPSGPVTLTYGQLKFPAAQTASSDVNTLDDYEEGTWTPTDASGAGLSFSVALGRYVKVGSAVQFSGTITYPSTSDTNGIVIGGLPFTASNAIAANLDGASFVYTTTGRTDSLLITRNTTTMTPFGNSGGQPTNANYSTKTIAFSGWYQASA